MSGGEIVKYEGGTGVVESDPLSVPDDESHPTLVRSTSIHDVSTVHIGSKEIINNYINCEIQQMGDQTCTRSERPQKAQLNLIQEDVRFWYKNKFSTLKTIPFSNFFDVDLDHVFTNLEIVPSHKENLSKRGHRIVQKGDGAEGKSRDPEVFKTVQDLANKLWRSEKSVAFVEGPAGIGKSTLCRRLAYTWAKNNFEIEGFSFKLVILLEARHMCGDLKQCVLQQLFPRDYKFDAKSIYDQADECGKECLIIIDGVDEINEEAKEEILDLLRLRLLPRAQILVTGRPEAANDFVQFCHHHLRIKGFSKENTDDYINKYFSPDEKETKEKLLRHISLYRNMEMLTTNPFTVLLLCILAEENPEKLSTNQFEVLHEITRIVCKRFISNFDKSKGICPDESKLLSAARNLAFNGVISGKLVFHKNFLLEYFPNMWDHLLKSGLLSRDMEVCRLDATGYCYFPHKTIQEFLCAEHLAHCPSEEFEQSWNSVKNKPDIFMKTCLLNLLGSNPEKFEAVFDDIKSDEWVEIMHQLVDVNSLNMVIDLIIKDNKLFTKLRPHLGRNAALLPLYLQKASLPPVCRFDQPEWFRELDCVKDKPRFDKYRVHVEADIPEGSVIPLFTREAYRIGEKEVILPVVNCYKYYLAWKILRRGLKIQFLNLFLCVITRGDIANFQKLLRVLARVQRPMTVSLILSFHPDNDYWLLKMQGLVASTEFDKVTVRVHVRFWSSAERQPVVNHFKHMIDSPKYPHLFYLDRYCPYTARRIESVRPKSKVKRFVSEKKGLATHT